MSFSIKYFRDAETVKQYKRHGIHRPVGWVLGTTQYTTKEQAQYEADQVNKMNPVEPCVVVRNG